MNFIFNMSARNRLHTEKICCWTNYCFHVCQSSTFIFWLELMSLIVLCMKPFFLLVPDCDSVALVGNGFCNDETNNADCNYDGGECCGPDISCKWPCIFHGKIWIQTNSPILDNAKDSVCLPSLLRNSFDLLIVILKK